jgi:hypothetical protein
MPESELKIMYKKYKRQKAVLDKLWDNILHELVRRAKENNIEME